MAKSSNFKLKKFFSRLPLRMQLIIGIVIVFCILGVILFILLSQITRASIFQEIPIVDVEPTLLPEPVDDGSSNSPNPTIALDLESMQSAALLRLYSNLQKSISLSIATALLLGILAAIWLSSFMTKPLKALTQELATTDKLGVESIGDNMPSQELSELQVAIISSQERFENQFEKANQFVLDAAHELGTPVAAIRMNIDVARKKPNISSDDYFSLCQTIDRSTTRMENLLDQLKILSKHESRIQVTNIRVGELLEDCIELLIPLANTHDIEIKNLVNPELCLQSEPLFLQTIFTNLIENAINYNIQGGQVVISSMENDMGCELSIEDTGIGISEEEIEKVFNRFYRIDKSRSRRSGGSGLGLSIVQALINRLGGHISLQSKLGVGTKVEVFIPHYKENDGNQYDAKEKNDIL